MLYLAFVIMAIGSSACSAVILSTVVGNWFNKKISIATGIVVCGSATGGLLVPLVTWLIDTYTWRTAMVIVGIAIGCLIPLLSLLVRHKPEQYGYLPDGEPIDDSISTRESKSIKKEKTDVGIVKQALKSRAFWCISIGYTCHIMIAVSVVTHIMPYLGNVGISRSTASLVASFIPLISILGRLLFGWTGDKANRKLLAFVAFVITALGVVCLCLIGNLGIWMLVPFLIIFGFGYGALVPLQPGLMVERYGRARLGTIIGLCMGVTMVGNVLGPPLAGWIFDVTGSYQNAWYILLGILVIGAVFILNIPAAGSEKGKSKTRAGL
jgi:sugar phosphate permease